MFLYLIKSGACLAAFYFFYLFFLEKENMHLFKRYYLLGSLVLAFLIPLVTFTEYINPPLNVNTASELILGDNQSPQNVGPTDLDTVNLPLLALTIYLLGATLLGFRFGRNLIHVIRKIRNNEKLQQPESTKVLLSEKVSPHTFLRYIFLNKKAFEAKSIPPEVLLHEETHVRQKHSLDIIFIELLQVLLWFNPFIYLINRSIKLNHEFLADQAVLGRGVASRTYQNTLLSFSSQKHQSVLANAINYSSFKKRFTVMKKQTSKRVLWLKGLLFLPLTLLLLVSFSTTEIKYLEAHPNVLATPSTDIEVRILIQSDLSLRLNDKPVAISELSEKILEIVPAQSISNALTISTSPGLDIPTELMDQLEYELSEIGISSITLNTREVHINNFQEDRKPVLVPHETQQQGGSAQQLETYNRLAGKYNSQNPEQRAIPEAEQAKLATLYSSMSDIQKAHSEAFPLSYPISQEEATPEMVAEYNALASKYNSMSWDNFRVIGSEVERLHYIYDRMSEAQRASAEPFPQFPEPPTEPEPAVAPTPHKEPAAIAALPSPPAEPLPVQATVGSAPTRPVLADKPAMEEASVAPTRGELAPPPPPKSPLEFVREMAEKGADFYMDGQKITAEKAVDILKESKQISLRSKHMGLERPVVELSTKPYKVKAD
ncbi:M56 family metallopeptidase [Poritiphilus flavus]|uniref:Peptidase M56 domain-containing protein n=1 Tax=Poritiphilus flavus TaxID=2697053 RepID=A0A6L9E6Q8_9FLAO|nr:M56 family metallopeptidase [Poritiphilus flavus]NAS10427.1 hypothetical protein [Poritiphilus flavus]